MGAGAAVGLRVQDSESGLAGVGDGFFYPSSEDVQGLYTEQQTLGTAACDKPRPHGS